MAERKQQISIKVYHDSLDVWCDAALEEQIRNIEGVARVGLTGCCPNDFYVTVDGRYDINEVAQEIRELVKEEGD